MDVTAIVRPDIWAQFGPMGLVSLALFVVLWRVMDVHRAATEKMAEGHRASIEKMLEIHRDERQEMRQEAKGHAEQLLSVQRETNTALQGLTMALERGNDRHRRGEDAEGAA